MYRPIRFSNQVFLDPHLLLNSGAISWHIDHEQNDTLEQHDISMSLRYGFSIRCVMSLHILINFSQWLQIVNIV